jgi:hypothetical protein
MSGQDAVQLNDAVPNKQTMLFSFERERVEHLTLTVMKRFAL